MIISKEDPKIQKNKKTIKRKEYLKVNFSCFLLQKKRRWITSKYLGPNGKADWLVGPSVSSAFLAKLEACNNKWPNTSNVIMHTNIEHPSLPGISRQDILNPKMVLWVVLFHLHLTEKISYYSSISMGIWKFPFLSIWCTTNYKVPQQEVQKWPQECHPFPTLVLILPHWYLLKTTNYLSERKWKSW